MKSCQSPGEEGENHDRDDDDPDTPTAGHGPLFGKLPGDELIVIKVIIAAITRRGNVLFPIAGGFRPARLMIGAAVAARSRPNRYRCAAMRTDKEVSFSRASHETELTAAGKASPCSRDPLDAWCRDPGLHRRPPGGANRGSSRNQCSRVGCCFLSWKSASTCSRREGESSAKPMLSPQPLEMATGAW